MDNKHSIIVKREHGKIVFKFKQAMDARHINRNQLANRAGIRFEVADRYYRGKLERIDVDVLARICYVLDCTISEVIEFDKH